MDNSQPREQQPQQGSASVIDAPSFDAVRKKRRTIETVVAVAAALCLCICVSLVAGGWELVTDRIRVAQERDDVTAVIDEFMREMEKENAVAAYALLSTRAQRHVPLSGIEGLLGGSGFEGYDSVTNLGMTIKAEFDTDPTVQPVLLSCFCQTVTINTVFNTDPDLPQGLVAYVSGSVTYQGGITGRLGTAVLEKEGDEWRLHCIWLIVSG